MERSFTSYGLIKFSLLNVLAITRFLYKGNYIKSREDISRMCQFCSYTNSLVRKYMLIFLNIFNTLKKQRLLEVSICDECTKVITNYIDEANILPTEAILKALQDIAKKSTESLEIRTSRRGYQRLLDPFAATESSASFLGEPIKNTYFEIIDKKAIAKCAENLSLIETVFNGKFKTFPLMGETKDLKFFEDNYVFIQRLANAKEMKDKEIKKKFDLKTPLMLYKDTFNSLNAYMKRYNSKDINYEDLFVNILCLIYYFKIPIIGEKWIESLRTPQKSAKKENKEKSSTKPKIFDKFKDKVTPTEKINVEEKTLRNAKREELKNEIIPDIITMLIELLWEIKNFIGKKEI
jgi:hypothetical protein